MSQKQQCAAPTPVGQLQVERVETLVPTWKGVLPIYLRAYESGGFEGRTAASSELYRMADCADKYNKLVTEGEREASFDDPGYV